MKKTGTKDFLVFTWLIRLIMMDTFTFDLILDHSSLGRMMIRGKASLAGAKRMMGLKINLLMVVLLFLLVSRQVGEGSSSSRGQ